MGSVARQLLALSSLIGLYPRGTTTHVHKLIPHQIKGPKWFALFLRLAIAIRKWCQGVDASFVLEIKLINVFQTGFGQSIGVRAVILLFYEVRQL